MLGTSGRTRTGTLLRAGDFESPMSTNSITLALSIGCASFYQCANRAAIIAVIIGGSTDVRAICTEMVWRLGAFSIPLAPIFF